MRISADIIYLTSLLALTGFVQAVDSIPCISGYCSHSAGDNVNSLVHSISINESQELIGDVTPAAGWNIQGCDPNWSSGPQTVNMTCEGSPDQTQYCDHLFNGGAENTIVNLPENCGTGPFARIVSINNGTDGVHTMQLDYNFTQIPPSRGNVSFEVTMGDSLPSKTSTALQPRFSHSVSKELPFSFQKSVTLFNESLSCSEGNTSALLDLTVGASGAANGSIVLTGSISGSIIPPEVDNIELIAAITGSGSLEFDLEAALTVSTSTGDILIFTVGLPGFDIPGIIDIGPTFDVNSKVDLDVELEAKATVTAQWNISNVQITLPSSAGPPTQDVTPTSSDPIHLSINPSALIAGNITVVGHLIPKLTFGISVFDASAEVFVEADLSASVGLGIVQNFNNKRDHPRNLLKRTTSACVSVDAGVNIDAGVTGSIGPLQDGDDLSLTPITTQLFMKCFNIGGTSKRRDFETFKEVLKRDNLQCLAPSETTASLESLI